HFFAGIGGWSYALRLAGIPDGLPVWTGSCPCQPFSAAGKGLGEADERHLWPVFRELIRACNPSVVFGEQVASKAGRVWLSGVFADLEGMAYHRAGADLCAAGVSAPHIRQRLYWLAYSHKPGPQGWRLRPREELSQCTPWPPSSPLLQCSEGRSRRIEPGISPLVNGIPGRVVPSGDPIVSCAQATSEGRVARLRGYGNSIVPQLAAQFILAALECAAIE